MRPWYAELGVLIADRYQALNHPQEAEVWYRQVLSYAPFHVNARSHLAKLLKSQGDQIGAEELCRELIERISVVKACDDIVN